MRWTRFASKQADQLWAEDMTWPQLLDHIRGAGPFPDKEHCPWFKGAIFGDLRSPKNSLRHDPNVRRIAFLEGDYDAEQMSPEEGVALLEQHQIRGAVYTSPRHTPDAPRWRVLAPLSAELAPEHRDRLMARLNGALGGILAPESFALSQSYYYGRVNGTAQHYQVLATFDDPEEGFFIDTLDDLDVIANGPPGGKRKRPHDDDIATDPIDAQEPTAAQWDAIRALAKFQATWDRERGDLGDYSASGYDLALANLAVQAGWPDGCILSLLWQWRTRHDERPEKLRRMEYVNRTLVLARENPREQRVVPDAHDLQVEDGLALAFARQVENDARWVQDWGAWLYWDGAVWVKDSTLRTYDLVRHLCRLAAASAPKKRATELRKASTVAAVERMARSDRRLAATGEQWDANPWVLNTPAGLVNLHNGTTGPHEASAYCTRITAVAPGGACPLWHRFLAEVTAGDADLEAFLQRVVGYALTGVIREHALFFLYGTGRNGKGVFLNTLKAILDAYATVAPMTAFTDTHHEQHPTDLAMLRGARLVIAQETEEGRNWAESRIKALTGGDPITARFMRQDFFTFTPQFKLLIAGNHKPTLRNVDEAIRGRLHLIPFTVTIPPDRRDPELADKLKAEWPGILQWAIDGCLSYQRIGLAPPAAVVNATAEYFEAQDDFAQWLEECCDTGRDYWEPVGRLFENWRNWAEASRLPVGTKKRLSSELDKAGFAAGRNPARGGRYRAGIRLKLHQTLPADPRPWYAD